MLVVRSMLGLDRSMWGGDDIYAKAGLPRMRVDYGPRQRHVKYVLTSSTSLVPSNFGYVLNSCLPV